MKYCLLLLFAVINLASINIYAQSDDIELGRPGYGGNGCPGGSASVTLSPDKKSLSIIFDDFIVETSNRRKVARKSCNIAIPVHVPQGYAVSIIEADFRGFISLPRRGEARFSSEYFFAGQRGPRYTKRFRGEFDDEYLIGNTIGVESLVWSKCGADVNLRVNSSLMVRTRRGEGLATLDSADFNAGIVYHVQWKRCIGSNNDHFRYSDF
jgi:hypothetical protein